MTQVNPEFKVQKVPATHCACCNREITEGFDVPLIGAVGPKCVKKFALFAQLLMWVEGRSSSPTSDREYNFYASRLIVGLRQIGIEVNIVGGELHVGKRTRKAIDVAKSWKKRRAEFERDLQIAQGDNGVVKTEWVAA